jgi:hypothetical protein
LVGNVKEKYTGFWWETLRKESLGKPRHRWKDNIKINMKIIYFENVDWIDLA